MFKNLLLVFIASTAAAAGAQAKDVTPTFELLANKCFSGSAYNRGKRTSVLACFNSTGDHAFYEAERYDHASGKKETMEIDTPVKITEEGKLVLRSFLKIATMTLSRDRSDRLKMKGRIIYEGEPWGSLSLKQSVTRDFETYQRERGAK